MQSDANRFRLFQLFKADYEHESTLQVAGKAGLGGTVLGFGYGVVQNWWFALSPKKVYPNLLRTSALGGIHYLFYIFYISIISRVCCHLLWYQGLLCKVVSPRRLHRRRNGWVCSWDCRSHKQITSIVTDDCVRIIRCRRVDGFLVCET